MKLITNLLYTFLIVSGSIVEKDFIKQTKNPIKYNNNVLFDILKSNSNTLIGQKYNFSSIKTLEDFKKSFPLTDYYFYKDYISQMADGKTSILVNDKIDYFGHTSGTTGSQKLIPVTHKSRLSASKYMALLMQKYAFSNFIDKYSFNKGLIITDIVNTTYTKSNIPICSATSGGMNGIKKILPNIYTSPIEVMKIKDKNTAMYLHLLFGLKAKNIMFIASPFISNILDLFRLLEKDYFILINDIKKGRINNSIIIDESTRKRLNSYLSPDASRADYLSKIYTKDFNSICKKIWPKLSYIACVSGGPFSIYQSKVEDYCNPVPIYSPSFAATEGMIGINPFSDKINYVLIPSTIFYEFIDVDENKNDKTYCIDEIKIGKRYEIILTNYSGFYRYKLGDVIEIVDFYNNCPVFKFLYRKNQVLNMVSEKTTEEHLSAAISNVIKSMKINIIDYTTKPDMSVSPGRYKFIIELEETSNSKLKNELTNNLDKELRKTNLAYNRFRNSNRLDKPIVELVPKDTFNKLKDKLNKNGISKNQLKIPRVYYKNDF